MGVGSMLVGFVTLGVQGFSPPVYPLVIASGAAWALGNSVAVPVMNNLGMALGMLIWNTTACILGWATSRFGLFGLKKAPPKSNVLNYIGLVLVIAGGVIYTFVKSVPYQPSTGNLSDRVTSIDAEVTRGRSKAGSTTREQDFAGYFNDELLHEGNNESFLKRRRHLILRGCWIVVALISGLFYSQMCTAVSYIQDYPELFNNAPANGVHYVFSHFLGIFITATAIFIVYGIVK
ncbi:hypothetical protein AB6A40_010739 [Gnathostoma spinigerum]|uniref:Transmembrane protein 144 n=1 Tax=Gnathostoma spinigerum TaxID=75299 RepID=A0ABD6F3T6_9BILA